MRRSAGYVIRGLTAGLLAAAVCITAVSASGISVSSQDLDVTASGFGAAYGWDGSSAGAESWTGDDGSEYRRRSGAEKALYEDSCEASERMFIELGILSAQAGSSGGGESIASVALREAALPYSERSETPANSNHCKYNDQYYGRYVIDPKDENGEYVTKYAWCAVFVWWCAEQCGLVESGLFTKTAGVRPMFRYLTEHNGFTYYRGAEIAQLGGSGYTACVGDIFCFGMEHIGIVTGVSDTGIEITQGNTANTVMTLRYTSASLYRVRNVANGYIIHVEYPQEIDEQILYFLQTQMGLNRAAAIGALTNMFSESGLRENALGDSGTSYGICQWHNTRWDRLKSFCSSRGYDWTKAEGQLWYLKYELENYYRSALDYLLSCPDNEAGCYNAAYCWCAEFEIPADTYVKAAARGTLARNSYYPRYAYTAAGEILPANSVRVTVS